MSEEAMREEVAQAVEVGRSQVICFQEFAKPACNAVGVEWRTVRPCKNQVVFNGLAAYINRAYPR